MRSGDYQVVSGAPALRASNLVGGYGARAVLHGVSLAVEPGEMLAIVGPNGLRQSLHLEKTAGYAEQILRNFAELRVS